MRISRSRLCRGEFYEKNRKETAKLGIRKLTGLHWLERRSQAPTYAEFVDVFGFELGCIQMREYNSYECVQPDVSECGVVYVEVQPHDSVCHFVRLLGV